MNVDDKIKQNRKRTRLEGYDYSASGMYFLTLCAKSRANLFSRIVGCGILDAPSIELFDYGKSIENSLIYINDHRKDLHIDHYVIMPNHVHLLVTVVIRKADNDGALGKSRPTVGGGITDVPASKITADIGTLGNRVLQYRNWTNDSTQGTIPKLISSLKRYTNKTSQYDLWQNGYYDHIIRDEQDYFIHWKYIEDNPAKWTEDKYYIL